MMTHKEAHLAMHDDISDTHHTQKQECMHVCRVHVKQNLTFACVKRVIMTSMLTRTDVNMTEDIEFLLKIPCARRDATAWITKQPPTVVADVLGMAESMYNSMTRGIHTDDTTRELFNTQLAAHDEQLQTAMEKALTSENERVARLQHTHSAIIQKYQAQLHDMVVQLEHSKASWTISMKQEVEKQNTIMAAELLEKEEQTTQKYTDELKSLKQTYLQQVEENRRIEGANAIFKDNVRTHFENKLAEYKQQHNIDKEMAEKHIQTELQRHANERDFLRTMLKDKDTEIKNIREHAEEKTNEIASVIRNITGSTTAVGRFGEHFVNKVHAQMELGTYSDDTHIKQQGFADGTWELTFPYNNVEKLICMADVKYGFPDKTNTHLHSQKDIKKFEDDTRAAIQMGRINCSMLISLVKRIPGKPRLSMDNHLGVPTVWVSRDADDAIPAQALIEMGFLMLAQAWPIISKKHNDETNINDILQAVANNLECQMIEYEKQAKQILTIEEAAHRQLRTVAEMRKVHTTLVQNAQAFRIRFPPTNTTTQVAAAPQDFWQAEGQLLIQAIKTHRATKGRNRYYAKDIEELNLPTDVLHVIRNIPNAFILATNTVKDEMQKMKRTTASSTTNTNKRHKTTIQGDQQK